MMPWCITCAEEENPDWYKFEKRLNFIKHPPTLHHKKIGFIQYLKCKYRGHRCYI